MTPLHTAKVTAHGGRAGSVTAANGTFAMRLAMPRVLGGPGEEHGTNPEQLFAAGYAACFESALRLVARRRGIDPGDVSVTAEMTIGKDSDDGYTLAAVLVGHLPGIDDARAEDLMRAAHEVCPYSKATR